MAILDYSHPVKVAPRCQFGGIENELAVLCTANSVAMLNVADFAAVDRKDYPSSRVLDAILTNGIVWVLLETNSSIAIELLRDTNFNDSTTQKMNISLSDQVNRLYKLDDAVVATGTNARRSAMVTKYGNQNIPISQVASLQALPDNLLGVVTGIYGAGAVLKIFRICERSGRLEELAEVSLRDILIAKQIENNIHIVSTDNERLYCSRLDVPHKRLDADVQLHGVECTFLGDRCKLLGNAAGFFGYPLREFSGLAGINVQKAMIDFQVDFGCRAYDIACYEFDDRVCVCYVDESGIGASYTAQTKLDGNIGISCALDYASLGELDLNGNESVADEERNLRLKKLGL